MIGSRRIWHRISWEIDEACVAISSHRWPDLEQRGDIFQDEQAALKARIDEIDPNQECTILLTAAPPCPDFSRIRPDAPGRDGPEGQKFDNMLRWFAAPSALFRERKVLRMIENVIMSRKADLRHFEAEVGVPAIIMDAQDWGLVKRPRVFWTDAGWQQFGETAMGWRIRWTKLYDTDHLTFEFPPDPVASILPPRWKPPKCLEEGKTLPTLTSPAPGPEGRPAPRSVKGKLDSATFHRWELSGRQFAPWHFRQENLFENERGELVTPSILVKERLHHLEDDFTAPAQDDRERHKILANSWHLGTAILVMTMLTCFTAAEASLPPGPELDPLGHTAIDTLASIWASGPLASGPHKGEQGEHWMTQCTCLHQHWQASWLRSHPHDVADPLEPGLTQTINLWHQWHQRLPALRAQLIEEITDMALDLEDDLHPGLAQIETRKHSNRSRSIRPEPNSLPTTSPTPAQVWVGGPEIASRDPRRISSAGQDEPRPRLGKETRHEVRTADASVVVHAVERRACTVQSAPDKTG